MYFIVCNTLGAGLDDITNGVKIEKQKNIIYCEGNDDEIYKIIFPYDENGNENVFVGVRSGGLHVINQYMAGKDIVNLALGENCKSFFVVDRLNSRGKGFDIGEKYIKTDGNKIQFNDGERAEFLDYYNDNIDDHQLCGRMLERKEVENYLYDSEIIEIAKSKRIINDNDYNELINLNLDINLEVKDKLPNKFKKLDMMKEFAKCIYAETQVYEELYKCIFQ